MTCAVCREPLPPYSGRGRPRTVCSTRCHNWRQAHGDLPPRWLRERTCERCSKPFENEDIRVRFCTLRCRRLAAAKSVVDSERLCRYCDASFVVTNGKQLYCNAGCRAAYNRRFGYASGMRRTAKRRGATDAGRFTMRDVGKRTGWICGLCLGPIDWRIRGDRYEEATVDHIVPISAGGQHVLPNCQLAHWCCNAAKRNSTNVIVMSVPDRGAKRVMMRWPDPDQSRSLLIAGPAELGAIRRQAG